MTSLSSFLIGVSNRAPLLAAVLFLAPIWFWPSQLYGAAKGVWWKSLCPVSHASLKAVLGPKLREEEAPLRARLFDLEDRFGPCKSWTSKGGDWVGLYGEAQISLRPIVKDNKLQSLGFGPTRFPGDTLEKLKEFSKKHQLIAVSLSEKEEKAFAHEESREVGVGELLAFPLLEALRRNNNSERVVRLRKEWQYFSMGPSFYWPEGTPLTLETLALLMFQQGDLVAMDHLWNHLGREAVGRQPVFFGFELVALALGSEADRKLAKETGSLPASLSLERRPEPLPAGISLDQNLAWRSSALEICGAALRVRKEPMIWFQGEAPEGYDFWWEGQGRFPASSAILRLFKEKDQPWNCVFVADPKGKARAMEPMYTLLERLTLINL